MPWSRTVGLLAIAGIAVTIALDLATDFWVEYPMLTAYASGLLLLLLGIAVINQFLAARSRRGWTRVAALAITQLRDGSRTTAIELGYLLDIEEPDSPTPGHLSDFIDDAEHAGNSHALQDVAARKLEDPQFRRELVAVLDRRLPRAQAPAADWATSMVNEPAYVWMIDEYVAMLNVLWQIRWALTTGASQVTDHPGGRAAVAAELGDVIADLIAYQRRLTAVIRSMLPWPAGFGPPPSA